MKLEKNLRDLISDWQKYADEDLGMVKAENNPDNMRGYLAGRASGEQACARSLQILLDEGGQ